MEEGYRDEEAKHSSALVNSGLQGSSGVENNGVQSLPILTTLTPAEHKVRQNSTRAVRYKDRTETTL
jgi:hypothetical protein